MRKGRMNPPMVDDYSEVPVRRPSTTQLQTMRRLSYRVLESADAAAEMVVGAMDEAAVTDRVNRALMEIEADWKLLRGPVETRRERFAELMGVTQDKTTTTVTDDAPWPEWAAARLGMETETREKCSQCDGTGEVVSGAKVSQQSVMRLVMDLGDNTGVAKPRFINRMTDPTLSDLLRLAGMLATDLEGAAAFCAELAKRVDTE